MPTPTKQPSPKTGGVSKPKGAVRSRTGCYTCRIRKKKCDEDTNTQGSCKTCVRLRVECLGFGVKRPEYLRDSDTLSRKRRDITNHLTTCGLIKGRPGSGSRSGSQRSPRKQSSQEDEYDMSEGYGSDTGSYSIESDRGTPGPKAGPSRRRDDHEDYEEIISDASSSRHYLSSVREERPDSAKPPSLPTFGSPAGGVRYSFGSGEALRPSSRSNREHHRSHTNFQSKAPHAQELGYQSHLSSDSALVHLHTTNFPASNFRPSTALSRILFSDTNPLRQLADIATRPNSSLSRPPSSLSSTYRWPENDPIFNELDLMAFDTSYFIINPPVLSQLTSEDLLSYYSTQVIPNQFVLADDFHRITICNASYNSDITRQSIEHLAAIHLTLQHQSLSGDDSLDIALRYRTLQGHFITAGPPTLDKAITALHMVSSILFKGGNGGEWEFWLTIAYIFVDQVLGSPDFKCLASVDSQTSVIIRTALWFDVLASVTRRTSPHFLEGGRIDLLLRRDCLCLNPREPMHSMLGVMNCDNLVVWAIAKVTELAQWKHGQELAETLSVVELVEKGRAIQEVIERPSGQLPLLEYGDTLVANQYRTSEIFRSSAVVYLHSVVSGDYPHVKEIKEGVSETITHLEALQQLDPTTSERIVRKVVFSIFVCGCLTDEPEQRAFLRGLLKDEHEARFGNSAVVKSLLDKVWQKRDEQVSDARLPKGRVFWWEELYNARLLLV